MSKKRASIIAASVLTAGLAIGGVTTGIVLANQPLNVTYYANNGTPAVTAQVNKGDTLNLPTPTREGYNFAGWYTNVGLTEQVTKETKLKNNSKLYAGWELANYELASANADKPLELAETAGLKSIGAYAFANSKLKSITIPETVTSIGEGAFSSCANLTTVNFNAINCVDFSTLKSPFVGSAVSKVVFGQNVEHVPAYLMSFGTNSDNEVLTQIEFLGTKVKTIGASAFFRCCNLTPFTLPEGITTIGSAAFDSLNRNGSAGATITLPTSLTTIGSSAFNGCKLTNLYINSNIYAQATSTSALGGLLSATNVYVKQIVEDTRNEFFLTGSNFYYKETTNGYVHFVKDSAQETKFTVSFYDENGGLLENQSVRYRGTASKTLSGDAITSTGVYAQTGTWVTTRNGSTAVTLSNIKENKTAFAKFVKTNTKKTLNECSWETIKKVSDLGYARGCFAVGDEKVVAINDRSNRANFNLTMQIADFNHDVDKSGKTIGITFVTKEVLPAKYYLHNMYSYSAFTNVGGWAGSEMRTYLNSNIYNLLPTDLKTSITSAIKKSTPGGGTSSSPAISQVESEDKLFLLSLAEINYAKTDDGYKDEGRPYALFANWSEEANYSAGSPERVKKDASDGSSRAWWLRSPHPGSKLAFWHVRGNGGLENTNSWGSDAICFAFCV